MASNNATFEQQVLELTNQERINNGLAPLKANAELNYTADKYAEEMAARRVLSHTGPDGSRPWDRAKVVGYEAQTFGENIASGQRTPQEVVQGWMNSPGHRANILKPQFTELGVGFHNNYWVQNFGSGDTNPTSNIPATYNSTIASASTPPSQSTSTPTPRQSTSTPTPPLVSNNATFEQQVFELTNQERVKNGLAPLKANADLNYTADKYAEEMAARRVLSHTGPDGSRPADRAKVVGYEAQLFGENIASGQRTPQEVVQGWMNSPGHRANILRPQFTELGVGFYNNYWVQNFGSGDTNPISNRPTTLTLSAFKDGDYSYNADDWLLNGNTGNNTLVGTSGRDPFIVSQGENVDLIHIFPHGEDKLAIGLSNQTPFGDRGTLFVQPQEVHAQAWTAPAQDIFL